jgi:hypothetical protein
MSISYNQIDRLPSGQGCQWQYGDLIDDGT